MTSQESELKSQSQSPKVRTNLKERCYRYSVDVIKFLGALPENRTYWVVSDQLMRSATSIGANVI